MAIPTLRQIVQQAVESASEPQSAEQITRRTGLDYKQVIDALNALHNAERITRIGRKFTARWTKRQPTNHPTSSLAEALKGFFNVNPGRE